MKEIAILDCENANAKSENEKKKKKRKKKRKEKKETRGKEKKRENKSTLTCCRWCRRSVPMSTVGTDGGADSRNRREKRLLSSAYGADVDCRHRQNVICMSFIPTKY